MGSLSMLFYIVKCFTVNLEKLAADAVRSVKVAGDARAFAFDSAGAEVTKQKYVFQGRSDVKSDALQPREIFLVKRAVGTLPVDHKEAAGGFVVLIESYGHE